MVAKDCQKTKGSTKAGVGEIDTSAPFQSVKDAVTLFGEGTFSGEKPAIKKSKPHSAQRVLAKETQLHLAEKESNKLKEQLKNAETTKEQALIEIESAKQAVEDLTQKLKTINESKDSAVKATEAAKHQAKQFEEPGNSNSKETDGSSQMDHETAHIQYKAVIAELDVAKQELRKIRQEYDASLEAKNSATKRAGEAKNAIKANMERADELSQEIVTVKELIPQVKMASSRTREEEAKIYADKDVYKQSYKARLEESAKKLLALKKDIDSDHTMKLEAELAQTISEIEAIRKEMDNARASDLDSVKNVTSGLDGAKESLEKVADEGNSLRGLVETLKSELDDIKKEHSELKEKGTETESVAGNLHVKLRKAKAELEAALAGEAKARGASDEVVAVIHQVSVEMENAKHQAEEMKQQAEQLEREAGATRIDLEAAEKKLLVALEEAEEAKAAETKAVDQIKTLSEKTDAARASTSEPGAQITLSRDEFESLSRKVEETERLSEMKIAAAMAQVEAVQASENEALKKLDVTQKEIEVMKDATKEALKKAEMAAAAKKAVEGELRRRLELEQKKAAEAAARILEETEKSFESSPRIYRIQKQNPPEKVKEMRKLEKAETSLTKKVLTPSLSGLFKKKNQVEGASPSYVPGEKPVWY